MTDKSLIYRWFDEVWNNKNEAAVDEMLAEDGIGHGITDPDGNVIIGPESFKKFHRAFVSAYPDLKVQVDDAIVEGDRIAARCTVTGTHDGHGIGLTPTNQPVEFTGMVIVKVSDGKIVEAWNEFNFMNMYQQLGALSLNLQ